VIVNRPSLITPVAFSKTYLRWQGFCAPAEAVYSKRPGQRPVCKKTDLPHSGLQLDILWAVALEEFQLPAKRPDETRNSFQRLSVLLA